MSDRLTDEELLDIKDKHSPMLWDEVSSVVLELIETRTQLAAAMKEATDEPGRTESVSEVQSHPRP